MNTIRSFATLALLLAAQVTSAAPAEPLLRVPLEPYRKSVGLHLEINGQRGFFAFDSGGGITLLSPAFARKAGCTPWGRLVGFQMMGQKLETPRCDALDARLDGHRFALPVAAVLDPAPLFSKDNATPIDGSVALDLFAGRVVTLDMARRELVVESEASLAERVGDRAPLPMHVSRELQGRALAVAIGVSTPKGPVWFELDTGNGGTLLVARPYAEFFGLDPEAEGPQPGRIAIAPGLEASGPTFTPDMILDGNLGMPFLGDKVITLDLAGGRAWIVAPPK